MQAGWRPDTPVKMLLIYARDATYRRLHRPCHLPTPPMPHKRTPLFKAMSLFLGARLDAWMSQFGPPTGLQAPRGPHLSNLPTPLEPSRPEQTAEDRVQAANPGTGWRRTSPTQGQADPGPGRPGTGPTQDQANPSPGKRTGDGKPGKAKPTGWASPGKPGKRAGAR